MLAHLIKDRTRHCENASNEAVNVALSIKFPGENITVALATPSTRARSSSDVSLSDWPPKRLKQAEISPYIYKGLDIPFSAGQTDVIKAQCLRALISTGTSFRFFEDPEVQELFKMMRTAAPAILPTGKSISGRLLNNASEKVEVELKKLLRGKMIGIVDDGWKGAKKEKLDGVCANVDFKVSIFPVADETNDTLLTISSQSVTLELNETTAQNKDGPGMADYFEEVIDRVEGKYGCTVIYFTTDSDGGAKKGRLLLQERRPWMLVPQCFAHQVRVGV